MLFFIFYSSLEVIRKFHAYSYITVLQNWPINMLIENLRDLFLLGFIFLFGILYW